MNKCINECLIFDHQVPWLFQNFSNDSLSLGVSFEISSSSALRILFNFTLLYLILQQKLHYFGIDNLMDMFCYVTSLLVLSITVIFIQVSKTRFVKAVLGFLCFDWLVFLCFDFIVLVFVCAGCLGFLRLWREHRNSQLLAVAAGRQCHQHNDNLCGDDC